jgi:hypothetical protein
MAPTASTSWSALPLLSPISTNIRVIRTRLIHPRAKNLMSRDWSARDVEAMTPDRRPGTGWPWTAPRDAAGGEGRLDLRPAFDRARP